MREDDGTLQKCGSAFFLAVVEKKVLLDYFRQAQQNPERDRSRDAPIFV
jgi:hypothetical protein